MQSFLSNRYWITVGFLLFATPLTARPATRSDWGVGSAGGFTEALSGPVFEYLVHDVSNIGAAFWNHGRFGYFEYPLNSELEYVQDGWLMFGCVRGDDTLVTNESGYPFEFQSTQRIGVFSTDPQNPNYSPSAVATQVFSSTFVDTLYVPGSTDLMDLRPHVPIGLSVTQRSYAWSGGFARSIIAADWWVKNVSSRSISDGVIGVEVNPVVAYTTNWPTSLGEGSYADYSDNTVGFVKSIAGVAPNTLDTIQLIWWADNDGNPVGNTGSFSKLSPRAAMGLRVLRRPPGNGNLSFNWWVNTSWGTWPPDLNWGPRSGTDHSLYRNSHGLPVGDRGAYHMMTNGEIDYDQSYAAIDFTSRGWAPPSRLPGISEYIAGGYDPQFILSYGPLDDIAPGDSVPFTVAFVAGPDFHKDPRNYADNFNPHDPTAYYAHLDFSNLFQNARWADWWFDNPGVDTDGDGNRGRFYLVNCRENGQCDTVYYKGDGVPDWRGPGPPPPPHLNVATYPREAVVRWTGARSETAKDAFSQRRDWEGYRLYMGRFPQDDEMSLVASWDMEDFVRYEYLPASQTWRPISYPYPADAWPALVRDSSFDVRDYLVRDPRRAYIDMVADTTFDTLGIIVSISERERLSAWAPEDYNRTNAYDEEGYTVENKIQQIDVRDTVIAGDTLSFGVYEAHLTGFNPGVPLYIGVTAFDYGDALRDFPASESGPSANAEYAEFIHTAETVVDSGLKVSVFPNPYKIAYRDGRGNRTSYYQEGYEGRGIQQFEEQDRRVHFINLPDTATIRIYSIDGDLVRTIHHPDPYLTTYPSSVGWDLVTRNAQAAVSGIYIWRVDSRLGRQMGKLVIIK